MKNLLKLIVTGLTIFNLANAQFFVKKEKIEVYPSYSEYVSFDIRGKKINLRYSEDLSDYVAMIDPNSKMVQNIIADIDTVGKNNIERSREVFNVLKDYGIKYEKEPEQLRGEIDGFSINMPDQIKYPDQTLEDKGGDCEDLSILYASCLLALGVPCALYNLPGNEILNRQGHMLNVIELSDDDFNFIPPNNYLLIYDYQDNKWLPVDLSGISKKNFNNAYAKGLVNIVRYFNPTKSDEAQILIPQQYQDLFEYEKESF